MAATATNENKDTQKEMEIVYGPDPQILNHNKTFYDLLQEYCGWINCIIFNMIFFLSPLIVIVLCFFPPFWIIGIVYAVWIFYDRETPLIGGRKIEYVRKLPYWTYRRNYYPVKMIKTAKLPPDTTYLFASFPHGLFGCGAQINFLSEANSFGKAYPKLKPFLATLNGNFKFPGTRELLLALGFCAASEKGILSVLNGPRGNVCTLIVGGLAEAVKIGPPGTYHVILKDRKGFVRVALKAGSSLVPVFSFGENDIYDQITNKWFAWLQGILKSVVGITLIIPRGRYFGFGILPYKRQITTVVGKPIKLPKVQNPTKEIIDEYHQIFIKELIELFEKYKVKYDSQGEKATLIVE